MLRSEIVAGEIPQGEHLVEEKVAAELGVSRGSFREALAQLHYEGLLETARRGYVVLGISEADIDEIRGLREVLEDMAASLAIRHASPEDDARLSSVVEAMNHAAAAGDSFRFAALDVEFHSSFYEIARHRRLTTAWKQLAPSVALLLQVSNMSGRDLNDAARAHGVLAAAFAARDLPDLQSELRSHIANSATLVVRATRSSKEKA